MGREVSGFEATRFHPLDDAWSPFDVDVDTGEVPGGSYPAELERG
jgi:hypothetical protein